MFIANEFRLDYNNMTRLTSNVPGVETRLPGFGNTSQVEWLDPSQLEFSKYLHESLLVVFYVTYILL